MNNIKSKPQPILFKDILKKNNPTGQILFSKVLQTENEVANTGAVSSSFHPTEESEIELLTSEEKAEIAEMERAKKLSKRT